MKNIKFLIIILTVAVFATSCETYDDYDTDRVTVVGFTKKTQNINSIRAGESKSVELDIFASDVASSDRTYNIIVVPIDNPDEFPPTGEENYSFDSTVTIPANERIGTITVTGTNVSLSGDRTFFRLAVEPGSDVASGGRVTVGLRQ